MKEKTGGFIISLDFELMYGMSDKTKFNRWERNAAGAREAIPQILNLFEQYGVKATWAVVGMLFAETKEELTRFFPEKLPQYEQTRFSNYARMADIGESEVEDPLHFAGSLVDQIVKNQNQEIATHTFSHYYCMEAGQTKETFAADIEAAVSIAKEKGIEVKSLVFPKNQFENRYLEVLHEKGIIAVRGNEDKWFYKAGKAGESIFKRLIRLADSYVNLSGYHCYVCDKLDMTNGIVNIPSSRFLRPFERRLKRFEKLKIERIKGQMRYAAKKGLLFHLWWHPHNFGADIEENFHNLQMLLEYYKELHRKYSFESITMAETAKRRISKV